MSGYRQPEVAADDGGIRPAGPKDACFYCKRRVGEKHKLDCVTIRRPVRLRVVIEYEASFPQTWGKQEIEFSRNESSWCASSVIEELQALDELKGCLCDVVKVEYVGEGEVKL